MEFWGVEVKPGKPLKIESEVGYIIHVSQASLGESKKENESVPLYVKVGDKKLVMGTLISEKLPHVSLDLFFEQEFELSHDWKNGSVFVLGYKSPDVMDGGDEEGLYSDFDDSEDEEIPIALAEKGTPKADELKPKKELKAKVEETKKGVESDSEEDESDDDDDEDEDDVSNSEADEMGVDENDSDDEDDSDDEEDKEEEETPKKVEPPSKKRPNGSAVKTPVSKKAKTETHEKTDGKKGSKTATPHPAKAGNKAAQSPKSGGVSCGSCKKSFNSEAGLQSHNKAKHGAK